MSRRIDLLSLPILSPEIALLILSPQIDPLASLPIVQQIQPEVSRKIVTAQVAALAP
jgi:hypothetical protein